VTSLTCISDATVFFTGNDDDVSGGVERQIQQLRLDGDGLLSCLESMVIIFWLSTRNTKTVKAFEARW
jgi:hypothetical protein